MVAKHVPMAIAYDFDGTLAPGNMQEHQFIPEIGMTAKNFWEEVKAITGENQADEVLVYMKLMIDKANGKSLRVTKDDFKKKGKKIKLFEGVEDWFDRLTEYGRAQGVKVEHYLISSGNSEIFEGTPIANKFEKVYASKFIFDHHGVPSWPALTVNFTTKTQYLFRINKGAHDLSDNAAVNKFVEKKDRPIPFENMVFIGDGSTDVPCFRLVKDQGGLSIAVFKPSTKGAREKAEKYLLEGRVHSVVGANYTDGSDLDKIIKANIDHISCRAELDRLLNK